MLNRVLIPLSLLAFMSSPHVALDNDIYVHDIMSLDNLMGVYQQLDHFPISFIPCSRTTVFIDSPGGMVFTLPILEDKLKSEKVIDTYDTGMAASLAAVLFTKGENRMIEPGAKLLFHEPRIMIGFGMLPLVMTSTDASSIVATGRPAANSELAPIWDNLDKEIRDLLTKTAKQTYVGLKECKDEMIVQIAHNLGKSKEWVRANLVIDNVDTILEADQAIALGVATHSGYMPVNERIFAGLRRAVRQFLHHLVVGKMFGINV